METKDWYKLTFLIESDSEEIIIWKLNELGIFSFSFEYLIKNENKKEVNIWLPIDDWSETSRSGFEKIISKLLNINSPKTQFFAWSNIKEEDWLTSWKKYWAPELVGNHFLILPCWINLNEKLKDKKIDLLAIHGINTSEHLYQAIRDGGCIDILRNFQKENLIGSIGFSTHGKSSLIEKAISTNLFDYVNLHWYFINQENTKVINLANKHDLGVFIISPSD